MLDLILSTIAFFVAAFFLKRYFDEQGVNKGMTRSVLVFVLASAVSFGVAAVVDRVDEAIGGKKHVVAADPPQGGDVGQLLKSLSAAQGR
jgi:hypothetical protein